MAGSDQQKLAAKPAAKAGKAGKAGSQEAPAPVGGGPPPKRVLVLTGPASGEKIMKTQLSKLIKKAEGKIEFVVYEGERECSNQGTDAEAVEIMSTFFRGLPMKMYDEVFFDERNWRCYREVRSTLETMQKALKELEPIDGILGFSMGANFAVMLAAQSYCGVGVPFKFVIPVCPNAPGYADQVRELFLRPVEMPALIIRGKEETYTAGLAKTLAGKEVDTLDEPVVSEHVVKLFKEPEVFTHPDGHRALPAKPKDQDMMVDKVIDFVMKHSEAAPLVRDPAAPAGLPMWRVPEGSGGRVVRWGYGLDSTELQETLRPGALVEEIELKGTRLHYHLVAGFGPPCGWVTTRSTKGKLLVEAPANAAGTTGEIWIVTIGTRGDLQPFVVLGMALKAAGYDVRLFGPPELSSFSDASGLKVTTICRGWSDRSQAGLQVKRPEAQADGGERDWELEAAVNEHEAPQEGNIPGVKEPRMGWGNFLGLIGHLGIDTENGGDVVNLAWLWNEMPKAMQTMMEVVEQDGRPDLLVYNHLMVNMGLLMWRKYGIRAIFANLGLEFHFAPRGEDSFNYNTLGAFDRLEVKKITNGLVPMLEVSKEDFYSLYNSKDRLLGTTKQIIYALPYEDQKVARDWKFTGFWIFDEAKQKDETASAAFGGAEVMQRLQEFLLDGDSPVYMGWGSMPTTPGLILILMQALIELRLRAVMVRGWGNLSLAALREAAEASDPERCEEYCAFAQENVLFIDKAPHEWLLQRCACTVHHGGAGTTAAGMRAGVPTIVVPLGYDQPVHGEWVQKMGMGVAASKMDVLTASEFTDALRRATSSLEMKAKAKSIAETLKKEPGVSAAVEKIRKIMRDDVRTLKAKERWEAEEEKRKGSRRKDGFWTMMKEEEAKRKEEWEKKRAEREQQEDEQEKEQNRQAKKQQRQQADATARGTPPAQKPAESQPPRPETASAVASSHKPPEAASVVAAPPPKPADKEPPLPDPVTSPPKPADKEPPLPDPVISPPPPPPQPAQPEPEPAPSPPPANGPPPGPPEPARGLPAPAPADDPVGTLPSPAQAPPETLPDAAAASPGQHSEPSEAPGPGAQEAPAEQPPGPGSGGSGGEAAPPPAQGAASELVIYIDRSLDISTTVSLRPGMAARDVKELLAQDDPTGDTKPEDFSLVDPRSGREVDDSTPVSGVFAELEIRVGT